MDTLSPPNLSQRLRTGLDGGLRTAWKLSIFIVPLYLAVDFLKWTGWMDRLGELFSPVMGVFGLPGEAALAFVAAFFLNLYAALAILVPLELDSFQVTQCGLMMGIAHNLLLEGGVLAGTGTRGGLLTLCRLLLAAAAGLLGRGLHQLGGS